MMKNKQLTINKKKSSRITQGGYSLVEMMVAVSLFTVVAMVSIAALISINDANKKAQTMRSIIDNLNFAIENMARNLRIGTNYHCDYANLSQPITSPLDCAANGASSIAFEAFDGNPLNNSDQVVYALNASGQIMKSINSGASFLPLTPYDPSAAFQVLTVDYLRFYVSGSVASDGKQPRVVVVVGGTARYNNNIQTRFQIQTSVSERRMDS